MGGIMFRSYIKIALRNLLRHKGYFFINILGLATGISACILIMLFVQDELSYDQFHAHKDRIYRVTRNWFNSDGTVSLHLARVAPPIGPLLENDFPAGIEKMVRIRSDSRTLLKVGDNHFIENSFLWAGESFFTVFSFPLLRGDPESVLSNPNNVVLTRSAAEKVFGSIDAAMNKRLNYEGETDLIVTGVAEDVPENSHFRFEYLGSLKTLVQMWGEEYFNTNWGSNNYATYLLFSENYSADNLREQIPGFLDRHLTQRSLEDRGRAPAVQPSKTTMLHLQKLTDVHLHSHLTSEWEANGEIKNVYLFTAIAFFILLIACINFMNLATARSSRRVKEIGMRKVLGAQRRQLIYQFLGESIFISFVAMLLAVILVEIVTPYFNQFTGKNLSLNWSSVFFLSGLLIFVGFLSGSYPAFYLSRFKPITVIRDISGFNSGRSFFRTALVIFQFTISISLIICMGIVQSQIDYWMNKDLGYTKDHIVLLPGSSEMTDHLESIKTQLKQDSDILAVSVSRLVPTNNLLNSWGGRNLDGNKPQQLQFRLAVQECDYDFIDTYQIPIIAGRNFSQNYATDDSSAFILNESAVQKFGWGDPRNAIGRELEYGGRRGRIIGIVKNFHFESLRNEIVPIIFLINKESNFQFSVRIRPENVQATLNFLEAKWAQFRPEYPFEFRFLDEKYHDLYLSEIRLGEVFGIFSVLAIFIACLGLLGLASFTAEQKTKEIGIRKVLGASVIRIVTLLTKEFSQWILIANLIAWPVAWYGMKQWLQDFAYRIDIGIWIFVISALLALAVAILTVSYQAIRAATANPIDALHYE